MKILLFITLAISLVMPSTLWAKNMALELDGETAIEVPNKELMATDASLYIGVGDSKSWFCTGAIDEIRIWEVARTEEEINEFMMKVLNGDEKGLNAHYTFDAGDANDNTKNGNDGKGEFGKPNYIDITKDLDLEPLAVDPRDKLATWVKQTR